MRAPRDRSGSRLSIGHTRAYLAWILVCVVWGTTYGAIRIALETTPPLLMAAVRWLLAGSVLILVLKARGETLPPRGQWKGLGILGILMLGFGNGAVVLAEQVVPSGLTAVLVAVSPFWMVGIGQLMPEAERLTRRHLVGLLIGFAGVVVLVWPEIRSGGGVAFVAGVGATQLACAGWATGSNYARRQPAGQNVLRATAMQMLFGGLFLLAAAVIHGEEFDPVVSGRSLGAIAYLVLAGSIVGFSAYAYALKHLPLSFVSLYAYVNPIIAVALGTLVLDEPITPRLVLASAVVLGGVVVVKR